MKQKKVKNITQKFLLMEEELDKTPKEIAEILEVDLSTYYKSKRGDIPLSSHFLVKVEHILGYSRDWLEFGKGNPKVEDFKPLSEIESHLSILNKLKAYDLIPILEILPHNPVAEDKRVLLDFLNLFAQKFR
ncbi:MULTISPECIES: helix-turn-helix domain-containing protein [Leptospira]|uniref:HTH cro/C1-type domain-containing protein n=1 Tax=Leptospira weilii str. UI 13098 TaxID=1088542 RepID=M6QB81_9LEPT|nr:MULTISPECIES: helix-turn-helix transcriptional regulator [Leptospira]EMN89878.1 hypothetical protein LEP1GSC108_3386 [Leptospira weilii str. UI 13098]